MPVSATSFHSEAVRGNLNPITAISGARIRTARINLDAANVIGGRSSSPTFIKSQVVPQIRQRISQTKIFMKFVFAAAPGRPVQDQSVDPPDRCNTTFVHKNSRRFRLVLGCASDAGALLRRAKRF